MCLKLVGFREIFKANRLDFLPLAIAVAITLQINPAFFLRFPWLVLGHFVNDLYPLYRS